VTALLKELQRMIAADGPISIERYMSLCLGHPTRGYYATRDPFGAAGDFTTAPEISQMFGELLGLWAAEVWRMMGWPRPLRLIELGPGRGTLMADLLRAARVAPGFAEAVDVHLVETSPVLAALQKGTLARSSAPIAWHGRLCDVPAGPAIVIANEFFDALPIRQFVRTERGWCERLVGLDPQGALAFGLAPASDACLPDHGSPGDILERSPAALDLAQEIAARIAAHGGAALIIDYGYAAPACGGTLQAVKRHAFADPLAEPGEADLTAHVDFASLAAAARASGASVRGPVPQGEFLRALGIETRARALQAGANAEQAVDIDAALRRLTGDAPAEMGKLFKVLAVSHPDLPGLPGFARAATR
jgi:SAM-dependent MidA family methyltransferase